MKEASLKEVCTITMGQAPPGTSYNKEGLGIPLIAGAGDFGELNPEPTKFTTEPTKISKPGDLILCIRATIGDRNWADQQYCLGRGVAGLRPKPNLLDTSYLWHWLEIGKDQLLKQAKGSTFKQVSQDAIASCQIPLPPLEEQRRIAAILDKADAVRRKRKQAIALTEELLRSAFLDMFGDPVANHKGWRIVPIESVASDTRNALAIGPFGSSLKVDDYRVSGHPVVFVRDIRENQFNWVSKVFVDDEKFQELKSHHVHPGDVVATKMGLPPCIAAVYPDSMPIGVVTADIIKVTVDRTKMTPLYVAAAINSDFCKRQVARFTEGITRPKVTLRDFKQLLIPCPPLSYQERWEALCHQKKETVK